MSWHPVLVLELDISADMQAKLNLSAREQFLLISLPLSLIHSFCPPGSKKMEHKGNSWHENCFTCNHCQQPIGTRNFVQKDVNNYCLCCYEKQFALQCVHCKKVLQHSLCLLELQAKRHFTFKAT